LCGRADVDADETRTDASGLRLAVASSGSHLGSRSLASGLPSVLYPQLRHIPIKPGTLYWVNPPNNPPKLNPFLVFCFTNNEIIHYG